MTGKTFKRLSILQQDRIESEVSMLLHAHRDCLRNRHIDTTVTSYDCRDGWYGEAFGVLRGVAVLGYGEFGSDNVPNSIHSIWNLKWWFAQIKDRVL
ncbi:MAG: hypothetical protein EPN91_01955, partial [Salinibacterium sp.]